MLDAVNCYRCASQEGFPRHEAVPYDVEAIRRSGLFRTDDTADQHTFKLREINEKRRAYCDRCFHDLFFVTYTETDVRCTLCEATSPRGVALDHVMDWMS